MSGRVHHYVQRVLGAAAGAYLARRSAVRFRRLLRTRRHEELHGITFYNLGSEATGVPERLIAAIELIDRYQPLYTRWLRSSISQIGIVDELPANIVLAPPQHTIFIESEFARRQASPAIAAQLVYESVRARIVRSLSHSIDSRSSRVQCICAKEMHTFVKAAPDASYLVAWAEESVRLASDAAAVDAATLAFDLERQDMMERAGVPSIVVGWLQARARAQATKKRP